MSSVLFAHQADADLDDIFAYTADRWSEEQAIKYVERLEEACERLARMPGLGRQAGRPKLRRWEEASHVIFYEQVERGIVVNRILHKLMSSDAHLR